MIKTILDTALLGTDRKPCDFKNLPKEIAERFNSESDESSDQGNQFLDAITYHSFYQLMGESLLKWEAQEAIEEIHEEKDYCSKEIALLLKEISEDSDIERDAFLFEMFQVIAQRNQILRPEVVLQMLDMFHHLGRDARVLLRRILGNRGEYILKFRSAIRLPKEGVVERGSWEDASAAARRIMFEEMHYEDPSGAIQLLSQDWDKESIRDKVAFAKIITEDFQPEDHAFVAEIYKRDFENVACKKVTERACKRVFSGMMASMEYAPLLDSVRDALQPYLKEKKAKQILGFGVGKTIHEIHLPQEPDDIWNGENMSKLLGIETKNSDPKTFDCDPLFWLSEVIRIMPFSRFWPTVLKIEARDCLKYFLSSKEFKTTISGRKIEIFRDVLLENAMLKDDKELIIAILGIGYRPDLNTLLDRVDQGLYERFVLTNGLTSNFYFLSTRDHSEENRWSKRFAEKVLDDIFSSMAKAKFYTDRSVGKRCAQFFPMEALPHLRKLSKESESKVYYNKWSNHVALPIERVALLRKRIEEVKGKEN